MEQLKQELRERNVTATGEEEDICAIDERRGARTYVETIVRQMQQRYTTIQEVAEQEQREQKNDNLGGTETTSTAVEKCSEKKGEDSTSILNAVLMQFMQNMQQQMQQQIQQIQQMLQGQQQMKQQI
uniref:Uncharacterized protein n=1 Tax=Glossina austeni TaxID=7395 RepID=A0A1A9UZY7_GLOAU